MMQALHQVTLPKDKLAIYNTACGAEQSINTSSTGLLLMVHVTQPCHTIHDTQTHACPCCLACAQDLTARWVLAHVDALLAQYLTATCLLAQPRVRRMHKHDQLNITCHQNV